MVLSCYKYGGIYHMDNFCKIYEFSVIVGFAAGFSNKLSNTYTSEFMWICNYNMIRILDQLKVKREDVYVDVRYTYRFGLVAC